MPYGTACPQPEVPLEEVRSILSVAKEHGIHMLDTAISYGASEEKLGLCDLSGWRIVSKLPEIPPIADIYGWMEVEVSACLSRLGIPALYGLLLHQPQQLNCSASADILKGMQRLKDQGLVQKIGISVYSPDEVYSLFNYASFDIVQAPCNLLDRRLLTSGCLDFLKSRNVEVHVRSVFLQGLLLMDTNTKIKRFGRWKSLWNAIDEWAKQAEVSYLEACLAYVNSVQGIDYILVGVNNLNNLEEILVAFNKEGISFPNHLQTDDMQLLNPGNWEI
jgi:aryl-alcohol dehydrogenase-like predicted oxidoreductase